MTDEERSLTVTVELPDDAPADPDRYHVGLYFRREADEGTLTTSERVDPEYCALGDGVLTVSGYPFRADRVLHRLKVSWDGDWTFAPLGDAEIET